MASSQEQRKRRGQIAGTAMESAASAAGTAMSIFTAAAAANAIPVGGQIAAAGLAIAGLLTKIFVGRKMRKKEREKKAQESRDQKAQAAAKTQVQATRSAGIGLAGDAPVGTTAPVKPPETPSFSTYGGGNAPTVQPTGIS